MTFLDELSDIATRYLSDAIQIECTYQAKPKKDEKFLVTITVRNPKDKPVELVDFLVEVKPASRAQIIGFPLGWYGWKAGGETLVVSVRPPPSPTRGADTSSPSVGGDADPGGWSDYTVKPSKPAEVPAHLTVGQFLIRPPSGLKLSAGGEISVSLRAQALELGMFTLSVTTSATLDLAAIGVTQKPPVSVSWTIS